MAFKIFLRAISTIKFNKLRIYFSGSSTSSIAYTIPLEAGTVATIFAFPLITGFPSTIVIVIFFPFTIPKLCPSVIFSSLITPT